MSKAAAAPKAAALRKPRAAGRERSRFGRLGPIGAAILLGGGVVFLSPIVHAFWGDPGVVMLGLFGLGFLLGRWTAN